LILSLRRSRVSGTYRLPTSCTTSYFQRKEHQSCRSFERGYPRHSLQEVSICLEGRAVAERINCRRHAVTDSSSIYLVPGTGCSYIPQTLIIVCVRASYTRGVGSLYWRAFSYTYRIKGVDVARGVVALVVPEGMAVPLAESCF